MITLEELAKARLKAETSVQQLSDKLTQLFKELEGGIPLSVAKTIVRDVWGTSLAGNQLIARFSSSFPVENKEIIRNTILPEELTGSLSGVSFETNNYLVLAFKWINATIPLIVEKLGKFTPDDVLGGELALSFRKESLRFIEAVTYRDFSIPEVEKITKWDELILHYESPGVTDGNYLFIADFVPELEKAKQSLVSLKDRPNPYVTFNTVDYNSALELGIIKITYLYCEFLENVLKAAE